MNINWETPRTISILVGVTAALSCVIGFSIGYWISRNPQEIIVHIETSATQGTQK